MAETGQMDVRPQQEMWKNFVRLVTWSAVVSVVALLLLAFFLV